MPTTGLSGNEIFCLAKKGYNAGNIVVGNSVHSLGFLGTVGSGLKAALGGELEQVTQLIEEGREAALTRMQAEADAHHASGITGVTSELIFHTGTIEFLSIGSVIHATQGNPAKFSTSADGQELYAQLDAGYKPICFAFGNVAYSMGIARGIVGTFKTLGRGEIKEFSDMFNHTRHLALERIITHAKKQNANAILGIKTTILPFGGVSEMLMIGTGSHHPSIQTLSNDNVMTSDLTNIEMWNLAKLGYAPMKLLLGTSVYSLGLVGGITSALKSFMRGEINELTKMIYDARENALAIINNEAKTIGADEVVGVKTYVYQLGNGLIEFLAIGTAVKKFPDIKTESEQLLPQAIIRDQDTFYDSAQDFTGVSISSGAKLSNSKSFLGVIVSWIIIAIFLWITFKTH